MKFKIRLLFSVTLLMQYEMIRSKPSAWADEIAVLVGSV